MIPFFDYRLAHADLQPEFEAAFQRVLASGHLILGPEVQAFEQEFARFVSCAHAVGVASGTDAIILALRALQIGAGDEIITVANAGAPTVAAIRATGAQPRFVDVAADTLLLDPAKLPGALTPRVKAIVPIHLYGQTVDLDAVLAFVRQHRLHVIEDCAQAHGATYRGRLAGSIGAIGCFSFYPTKNLGAFGDGGMCVTNDAALAERLRMLRMYGFKEGDRHSHIEGLNSRLDELQAALLRIKLRRLEGDVHARRRLAERYRERLHDVPCCRPLATRPECEHAFHLFVVQSDDRAQVGAALQEARIGWSIHYPIAAHLMEAYRESEYRAGDLSVTEHACATVLSLPLFPGLQDDVADQVWRALKSLPASPSA